MRSKVYVETSVVSYLTAWPSIDVVCAGHQRVTREWWARSTRFELYISQLVLDEAALGDPEAAVRRLAALAHLPLLDVAAESTVLAKELVLLGGLPASARVDALHVAVATAHGMDYLVTWNCRHIANAKLRGRINAICRAVGYEPPLICTPLELLEE